MFCGMQEFSREQEQKLVAGPRFTEAPTERVCPACGKLAVRMYIYRPDVGGRPSRITYAWCASCRRFKGWTGPDLDDLQFSDPLSSLPANERRELQGDLDSFLQRLDELWDAGELPQNFSMKR